MNKIRKFIHRKSFTIKDRIFLYYMLFLCFTSVLTITTNVLSNFDFSYNYKWIGIVILTTALFIPAYRQQQVSIVHRIGIYSISFIVLPLSWLSSSGLASPAVTYAVTVLIMINYLSTGKERIFLNIAVTMLTILLVLAYYHHPDFFMQMTKKEQLIDWLINIPLIFTFICIMLAIFEQSYEHERLNSEKHKKALEELSVTDPLTGLYNRIHLKEKMNTFYRAYRRTGLPFSIIIIDIDFFKNYNDTYGHVTGDKCLKDFSRIITSSLTRDTDWAYRYGGEEFMIVMGYTDINGAETVAKRIKDALEKEAIPHRESSVSQHLTVSMGISFIKETHSRQEDLINEADNALYYSKNNGRNRITVFRQ